jgi:hypothetical protein
VDDIKGVQEKAALKKESLQIAFILDVLSRTPMRLVQWRNRRSYVQTWGKGPIKKFLLWLRGSYWKPELKQKQPKETSVSLKVDSMLEVVSTMDKRVQSLSEQTAKLEKMMLHFTQEQERHFDRGRQRRYYRLHSISEPNITAEDESFNDDV